MELNGNDRKKNLSCSKLNLMNFHFEAGLLRFFLFEERKLHFLFY